MGKNVPMDDYFPTYYSTGDSIMKNDFDIEYLNKLRHDDGR